MREDAKKIINIVFTADANYTKVIGVAMTSILCNLSKNVKAKFFIFSKDFTQKDIEELFKLKKKFDCEIVDIPMEDYQDLLYFADDSQFNNKWVSLACYFRLLIFKILPEDIDEVFYIDGDMIVNCDLTEIRIMENQFFAAVIEALAMERRDDFLSHCYEMPEFKKFKESPFEYPYFNAGFWLVNLKKSRELNIFDQMMKFLKDNPHPPYADQDTLNAVIGQNYTNMINFLPPKYNMFCAMDYENQKYDNTPYGDALLKESVKDPQIIHYAGGLKPWSSLDVLNFQEYWWEYCQRSPWKKFFNEKRKLMLNERKPRKNKFVRAVSKLPGKMKKGIVFCKKNGLRKTIKKTMSVVKNFIKK